MRAAGFQALATEDPGWGKLREAARLAGLEVVPVPVDEHGLQADLLADRPAVRAAIVSPAHQFPTGSVLMPERRAALLDWARRVDGLILEDDYDAEFRYDRRPVGTMQGTDSSRVALLGSLSKTLAPALGMGWVVTPPAWTEALRSMEVHPAAPPLLDQLTFAQFLGAVATTIPAGRPQNADRRDALVAALAAPAAPTSPRSGGPARAGPLRQEIAARRSGARLAWGWRLERRGLPGPQPRGRHRPGAGLRQLGDGEVERAVELLARAVAQTQSRRRWVRPDAVTQAQPARPLAPSGRAGPAPAPAGRGPRGPRAGPLRGPGPAPGPRARAAPGAAPAVPPRAPCRPACDLAICKSG
jgi:GntR family transcriptional regulator/MocR family aminotransferase